MLRAEWMFALLIAGAVAGCKKSDDAGKPAPPATVSGKKPESDIARITLTPEAASRIGIAMEAAEPHTSPRTRTVGGDVMPSSGRSIVVVAPVAGRLAPAGAEALRAGQPVHRGDPLVKLTPVAAVDRDLRATADRGIAVAASKLEAMESRLTRAERLLRDGAGSARAAEEARAERDTAKAELEAAKSRVGMLEHKPLDADVTVTLRAPEDGVLRSVSAPASSLVPAGAPLFELVGTGALWVKVNVFVGDLRAVRHGASARIRALTAKPSASDPEALAVTGPPTADPLTSSFDLYYALPKDAAFTPGERVAVTLEYGDDATALHVPESAILRDPKGSAWVYVAAAERTFERRHVEVERVERGSARLARGLEPGTSVVVTGAVELYGIEFGAGK